MTAKTKAPLVQAQDFSIHRQGCSHASKPMHTLSGAQKTFDGFEGNTVEAFTDWYIAEAYRDSGEVKNRELVLEFMRGDIKPCARLK